MSKFDSDQKMYVNALVQQLLRQSPMPSEVWTKLRDYGSEGWEAVDEIFDQLDPAWQYSLIALWGSQEEPPLPREAAPRLTQLTTDKDISRAHSAAVALARLGEPHTAIALQRLIADLENPIPEMQVESAIASLQRLGMPLAAPAIPALERVVTRRRVWRGFLTELLSFFVYTPEPPNKFAKQVLMELLNYNSLPL